MEKGNKMMMIIIIALLVVLLAAVGVLSFYALNTLASLKENAGAVETESPAATGLEIKDLASVSIGDMTTNILKGPDGKEYMYQLNVTVLIDNTKEKESEDFIALALQQSSIDIFKDSILEILHSMTNEDLATQEQISMLKLTMLEAFRDRFGSNLIYEVVMTNHKLAGF